MCDFYMCPNNFRENCALFEVFCHECAANDPDKTTLKYRPLTPSLPHPYISYKKKIVGEEKRAERLLKKSTQTFKTASKNSREGRKQEYKVLKSIEGVKRTNRSGAAFQDGDGFVKIGETTFNIEHKTRLNSRHVLGPTKEEWEVGHKQGIDIFITTSKDVGSVVTMPLETYKQLTYFLKDL